METFGRHAFRDKLSDMVCNVTDDVINTAFKI